MNLEYNTPLKLESINYFTGLWLLLCHDPSHDFNISNFAARMASIDDYIRMTAGGGIGIGGDPDNSNTGETNTSATSDIEDADEDKIDMNVYNEELAETIENFNLIYQKLTNESAYTSEKRYQTRETTKTQNMIKLYTDILDKYKFYIISLIEEPLNDIPNTIFSNIEQSTIQSNKRKLDGYDDATSQTQSTKKRRSVGGSLTDMYSKMDNQLRNSLTYVINNKDTSDKVKNMTNALLYGYEILQSSNTEISPYIIFNSYYMETMVLFVMVQDIIVDEDIIFTLLQTFVPYIKEVDYTKLIQEPEKQTVVSPPKTIQMAAGAARVKRGGNSQQTLDNLKSIIYEIKSGDFKNVNLLSNISNDLNSINQPLIKKLVRSIKQMLSAYGNQNRLITTQQALLVTASERNRSKIEKQIQYLIETSPTGECDKLLNMINEVEIKLNPPSKSKSSAVLSSESKRTVSKVSEILVTKFLTLSETFGSSSNELDNQYLDGLKNIGESIRSNKNMSSIDEVLLNLSDWYFENKVDETYEKKGYNYYSPVQENIFEENPIIINNSAQTKDYWGIRNEKTVGCSYTTYLDAQGAISSSCTSGQLSDTETQDNFEFSLEDTSNANNYYVGGFYKKSKNIGNIIYTTQYADELYFTQNIKVNISNLNSINILSANNTLKRVMDTLTQLWSSGVNLDWDTRWSYFDNPVHFNTLLSTISEKGIGDFYQEMNVIVRNGGYKNTITRPRKGTMGDRPSGCRGAYYLLNTTNPKESIHTICDIGYYIKGEKSISLYYNVNQSVGGKKRKNKTRRKNRKTKRNIQVGKKQTKRRSNKN